MNAQLEYGADGRPLRLLGTVQDITDRKQAEETVRKSEERLRMAQKVGRSGTWESSFETRELITSPEMRELFGLSPAAPIPDEEQWRRIIYPEGLKIVDQLLKQEIEEHTEYHIEFRINRNGTERWIESTAQIFYDASGKPLSVVGVSTDITERKAVEKRERELKAEAVAATATFRAVFEQTPVFAGIMTPDGEVIDANRLCLEACGYRPEEVLGKFLWETAWWRKSSETQSKIRNATKQAAEGIPYREILSYHWADGTERLVDFALHPIQDHEGRILFLHPTGVDITDFKRVEAELRKSHDDLEQRVEGRTQELAASLASLESEITLRKKTEQALRELSARSLRLQDEERRRFARDLHDSTGQTLVALKMTLAALNPMVASVPKVAALLNDLEALTDQAVQEIRTTSHLLHPPLLDEVGFSSAAQWYVEGFAQRSGVKTELELSVKPSLTKDEELVFFRILQESLTNVLRHSGSKSVEIRLDSNEQNAILSIRDHGKGIPARTLHSFHETGSGVGVGLGGMKQRVRDLGGYLSVESDSSGTCVTATLPLTQPDSGRQADPEQPAVRAIG
jgi:PAS domain S-box-containing protein